MGILRQPVMQVPTRVELGADEQDGFGGGVNAAAAVGIVDPTQCAAVTNMRLVRDQEMAKRPGLKLLGTTSASAFPAGFFTGTPAAASSGTFVYFDTANAVKTAVWDDMVSPGVTFTARTARTANYGGVITGFAQFRDATEDQVYVATAGASAKLMKWKSTNMTEGLGSVFGLGALWVYNQRLFGCKSTPRGLGGTSQTLYYSGLNNGDTMGDTANGGGSVDIRTFGGQNILGGFALGGANYILHERAISVFRGLTFDDISITAGAAGVSPDIGYPRAWQVIDEVGYVLTEKGLYLVTADGSVSPYDSEAQPDPILALFRAQASPWAFSYSNNAQWFVLDNARRSEVWFIVTIYDTQHGGIPVNSYAFIYHKRHRRFTGKVTFGKIIDWAGVVPVSNLASRPQMMFFNSASGKIFGLDFADSTADVFQDDSVNYTSSVQMRRFYTQKPSYQKAFRFLNVNMGGGSNVALAATGTNTGASVTYTTPTGGTVADTANMKAQAVNIIQLSGQGSYLDATITDNGASSTGWSVLRADVDAYILAQRAG